MAVVLDVTTKVETSGASQATNNLTNDVGNLGEVTSGVGKKLDQMTGGAITAFKSIAKGAKAGIKSMFTLKGAIAATGIGLLVTAVGTLFNYFTNTQRGADKLNVAFKAIGTTIDVLVDRMSTFGEGLFKIITGDFEEGLDILAGSFKGVTSEIISETEASIKLEKASQKLRDEEIKFIKVKAEKERAISSARLAAEDESKTDKERMDALKESIRIQNELTDEEIKIETERARIIRERVKLGESMEEDLRDQAEAEANVIRLETERDTRLKSLQTRLNAFTGATEKATSAIKKQGDEVKKQLESNLDAEFIDMFAKLDEEKAEETRKKKKEALDKEFDDMFAALEKEKEAKEDAAKRDILRAELLEMQKSTLMANGQAISSELFEKGTEEGKAFAAVQATYNTYAAIAAQLKAASAAGAIGPLAIATAISTGAFGFLQVKKILSTKSPSTSGGGGGSIGGFSGAAGQRQGGTLPNIGFTDQSQLGDNQAAFKPARAYVIQQDIKSQSSLAQTIEDRQRI